MIKSAIIVLLISFWSVARTQPINTSKSYVNFKIGNMGLGSVDGTFKGMKGTVIFDTNNLSESRFDVTIDPASVDTNKPKRDAHLKEEDFFEIEKYVIIGFISTEITSTPDGYVAKGNLTLHGVTNMIEIPFSVSDSNGQTMLTGEIEVSRSDYNLATESYSNNFMVGSTAEVTIVCVLD